MFLCIDGWSVKNVSVNRDSIKSHGTKTSIGPIELRFSKQSTDLWNILENIFDISPIRKIYNLLSIQLIWWGSVAKLSKALL